MSPVDAWLRQCGGEWFPVAAGWLLFAAPYFGVACLLLALLLPSAHAQRVPGTAAGWSQVCPGPEGFVYPADGVGTLAYCLGPQANGLTFDGETLPNAQECVTAQASQYAGQGHSCANPGRALLSAASVFALPDFVAYEPPVDPPDPPASAASSPLATEATVQSVDTTLHLLAYAVWPLLMAVGYAGGRLR